MATTIYQVRWADDMKLSKTYGKILGKTGDATRIGGDEITAIINTKDRALISKITKDGQGYVEIYKIHLIDEDANHKKIQPTVIYDKLLDSVFLDGDSFTSKNPWIKE